jgi:hypothetical protein
VRAYHTLGSLRTVPSALAWKSPGMYQPIYLQKEWTFVERTTNQVGRCRCRKLNSGLADKTEDMNPEPQVKEACHCWGERADVA